jgi:hypothetical protein
MRRELLELKVTMAQEQSVQRVVSRDGGEDGDGDRRGAVPDLPFSLPPESLLQPTEMEYAFSTRPCYISPFDPCNSNPLPSTTVTDTNNLPATPGAVIAGPSLSQTPSASYGVDLNSAYISVPLQYYDHYRESHLLQNPQGCRWHYCSVCRGGGERVVARGWCLDSNEMLTSVGRISEFGFVSSQSPIERSRMKDGWWPAREAALASFGLDNSTVELIWV